MPAPLVPARIDFTSEGVPRSPAYGDVYHSAQGGPEQARHVFLRGNGLPERWQGQPRFVVLETGFGFGLNFLATWQAWREDGARCARLHYAAVEKHPLSLEDMQRVHKRYPQFAPLARQLQAQWPMLVPGMHRLFFEDKRVVLTLALSDVAEALPQLRLAADALYLDGFSPACNPEMWSQEAMRHLARLCAPRATAATWSAAGAVRESLHAAGFEVEKRPGFAHKREMTVARVREGVSRATSNPPLERSAIVVGAGMAGASVCERLCAHGWAVTLIERNTPSPENLGKLAAVFHPIVTRDDSYLARLTRAGYLAALQRWAHLDALGCSPRRAHCGVLQLARDDAEALAQGEALDKLCYPAEYAQKVSREQASALAGVEVAASGVWFERSGWIDPIALVRALLDACGGRLTKRFGTTAARLERRENQWRVLDAAGAEIVSAPVLVLANAAEALHLSPSRFISLRQVRGQITCLPASALRPPRSVVLRGGFVLPAIEDRVFIGASFDVEDCDPAVRPDSHAGNLHRLSSILPATRSLAESLDLERLEGRVGFRTVAPDRLPLAGAIADESAFEPGIEAPVPRQSGLYGVFAYASRGTIWSALAAELIASQIEDEPLPLDHSLAAAVDPARFALRALRRGTQPRARR